MKNPRGPIEMVSATSGSSTMIGGSATLIAVGGSLATRLSLMAGIAAAVPGAHIEDISGAVEDVASEGGYGIVRQYVGHGIGTQMHEDPQVPNFRGGGRGRELKPGMCLAIEPMLTLGSPEVETLSDHWTVVTRDHSPAAHFEHTIAVTEQGPVILTTV